MMHVGAELTSCSTSEELLHCINYSMQVANNIGGSIVLQRDSFIASFP